ncbi:MAG: alpha/beta hydrolase [Pseudomonadota bacterium]
MPVADSAGRALRWGVRGCGPRLVLSHAALASSAAWDRVAARLEDRFEILTPDLPGHGGTAYDPDRDFQAQAMSDLDHVAGPDPVHLAGHSFGATAALHFAVRQPARVRSLTLIEPVYFVLAHDAGDPAYAHYLREAAPLRAAHQTGDIHVLAAVFLDLWGAAPFAALTADQQQNVLDRIWLVAASEPAILAPETPGRLRLDRLRALHCPVTVLRGGASRPVMAAVARAVASCVPAMQDVVVEAAGHMLPLTHPQAAAKAIADCADRVAKSKNGSN